MTSGDSSRPPYLGSLFAILAFSLWGVFPVYFKAVANLPAFEVLSHRVLWSAVLVGIVLVLSRRMKDVVAIFSSRRLLGLLALSSLMITLNWLVFIWAVANDMLLQTSLGYFINPLVSVGLGIIFFKERLRRGQTVAVLIALMGVGNLVYQSGTLPWISLSVAFSFGFYGLLRKIAAVQAFAGLFVETLIVLPPVLAYLIYVGYQGTGAFGTVSWQMDGLLVLAGVMTATPLVLFAMAANRLRLASLGFFQYIAPTGHFVLAVLVYDESFTTSHAITFGMIWLALAIFSFDSVTAMRHLQRTGKPK